MKIFCALLISVILLSGCTTKNVFKTEITEVMSSSDVFLDAVQAVTQKCQCVLRIRSADANANDSIFAKTVAFLKRIGGGI